MEKLTVFKRGKVYTIKLYGKEWELILPKEPKKKKSPTLSKKTVGESKKPLE